MGVFKSSSNSTRFWNLPAEEHATPLYSTVLYVLQGVSFFTRYWDDMFIYPLSATLEMVEKTIWVTKPVSEFLFDGYTDPLISMASSLPGLSSLLAPWGRVGMFYGRNDSASFDGVFNVETGTDDVTKRGILRNKG